MLDFSVTFIITIINIAILTVILRAILFKPVTKFMAEREKRVHDSIERTEKDKWNAKQLLEHYEKRLASAEAEAEEIIQAAHKEAEAQAEQILAASRAEAKQIVETAQAKLETERLAALALFKIEAAALVVKAAGRLLKRELAGAEQQRYAAEALDQIILDAGTFAGSDPLQMAGRKFPSGQDLR